MLIIHGDDQVSSRRYLLDQKKLYEDGHRPVLDLSADNLTFDRFYLSVNSATLLGSLPVILLEKLFSSRPNKEKNRIIDYLLLHPASDVLVWEDKNISPKLKSVPPASVKTFDFPKVLWNFIDQISVPSYHRALTTTPAEVMIGLLAKRIHDLMLVQSGQTAAFPPWQLTKLKSQMSSYSQKKLIRLHTDLLRLDFQSKTSATVFDLPSALELWVAKAYYL